MKLAYLSLIFTSCVGFDLDTSQVISKCYIDNQLCKWNPTCAQSHGNIILRSFLVTGSGSSGTTWFRQSMTSKGFDIADESFGVYIQDTVGKQHMNTKIVNTSGGVDGMVAWTARCFIDDTQRKALSESDEGFGHVLFPIGYEFRFRFVIHLVRHPLKAINSDLFFSSNIRQCNTPIQKEMMANTDKNTNPVCQWDWWRLQIWSFVSIFTFNVQDAGSLPEENDLFWTSEEGVDTFIDPVKLSAQHWYRWNLQVGLVSDLVVRAEDADSPTNLCYWLLEHSLSWSGVIDCDGNEAVGRESRVNSHGGGEREQLTWELLALKAGDELADNVRQLAHKYGYD